MEKVKLTQEQADSIKKYKEEQRRLHAEQSNSGRVIEWFKPLEDLETDEFMDALYEGYEVEPEFKVGDWINFNNGPNHGRETDQIIKISSETIHWKEECAFFGDGGCIPLKYARHATPEEIAIGKRRRWWAKHNRGELEFKKGDLLEKNGRFYEVWKVEEDGVRFEWGGKIVYQCFLSTYNVVCFAEDRKDVEHAE